MIFDLEKYIDEPLVYFDDKRKIDDQKVFLLGVKIRADMVDLLLNGIKAKDIVVKKLDPAEDWGFELTDPADIEEPLMSPEEELANAKGKYAGTKFSQVDTGEAKILKKTITNFKMSDSRHREGAVLRALQDDFDVIRDQLNNELNVFPAPMREMIMMTLLDRFHSWEKFNWDSKMWD